MLVFQCRFAKLLYASSSYCPFWRKLDVRWSDHCTQTKIYDFPYPISDLTLKMYTLFQTLWCVVISATLNGFTAYGTSWRPKRCSRFFFFAINIHGDTRYSKNLSQTKETEYTPYFRPKWQNLYPISDQKGLKMGPFGATHTYRAYIWEYPPPPPGFACIQQCVDFARGTSKRHFTECERG